MTKLYDAVIIGGGPAGLCAAINGASEGLQIAVLDGASSLGGQAKESASIENYPLPLQVHNGVTGTDLMQGFAAQAGKFGADIFCPVSAARLSVDGATKIVTSVDFTEFRAKTVILAMGLSYRRLEAEGIGGRLMNRGVFYGVPSTVRSLTGKSVAVIGGANSAGQAALRLARTATKVYIVVRRKLEDTMSQYLIDRIQSQANIQILEGAAVKSVSGKTWLEAMEVYLQLSDGSSGVGKYKVDNLFIYIGAIPYTAWLPDTVKLDAKKFILTDSDLKDGPPRLPNETSFDGVFAAGDVRFGQVVKRITGAVGDGISSLQSCHRYCANWKG